MTNEADGSVILSCGYSFLGVVMSDCVTGVGHSPVRQISLQILVSMSVTVSPPCFLCSAGMLSTPAALPVFSARIPASTSWS